ncbi:MAG: hypothetical protein J6W45_02780 [Bacteroidales bacterium]|nr:hypothetical protein [Bacteroidales bacterium]
MKKVSIFLIVVMAISCSLFAQNDSIETIARKGMGYYYTSDEAQTRISNDELHNLFSDEMFELYDKGKSLYRKSLIFGSLSAGLVVGGGTLIGLGWGMIWLDRNSEVGILATFGFIGANVGVWACGVGVCMLVPTTILAIRGKHKLNKVRDSYNSGIGHREPITTQLKLNVSPTQIGLSLHF